MTSAVLTRDVPAQVGPARAQVRHAERPVQPPGEDATSTRHTDWRWLRSVTTVLGLAAAFVAVHQLGSVDLLAALAGVDLTWAAVTVVASVVPFLGAAISLAAFTPGRLPLGRAVSAQVAASFLGVVVPPTVGQLAVNARLLQRLGHVGTTAAAVVGLTQLSSLAVTLVLLGAALTISGGTLTAALPSTTLLLTVLVLVVVALALLAVPALRQRFTDEVLPRVRLSLSQLRPLLRRPARLAAGFGGNLLLSAGYVLALYAALQAVNASPSLPQTAVVLLVGNAVGSAAPTPGGVGAVEAALTAGLVAAGTPLEAALPAVLLFRLATVWLRVLPGWVAFTLLQRRGHL